MRYTVRVNGVIEKTSGALAAYKDKKLAVGLSGGRDSVCLLHAVLHCTDKQNIVAVHINHRLRDSADRDERFVKTLCASLGVELLCFGVDVRSKSETDGETVEQAARTLRYEVFGDVIKSGRAEYVLTAHHAFDNAETVLMHLFRGAGVDGLCGIAAANDDTRILRPLLNVYPSELDAFVREYGLEYVTDETNFLTDADRNFIRLKVMPLVEQRYAGAVKAINELAGECKSVCRALDDALDLNRISLDHGAVKIDLFALTSPLGARYVRRALEHFSTVDITREQICRVVKLAHMRMGAVVELSGGIKAVREYDGIAIYLERLKCEVEIPIKLGANFIDGLAVDIERTECSPSDVKGGVVDLDKLSGATLRFRRDGDVFTPFGGVRKKLKRFFIDSKIEKRLRDRVPLICRGSEVLVVVGVQIADSVKVNDDTVNKAAVKLRW